MRRLTAYVIALAIVLALITAPLFHSHDQEEHGHHVSLIHAHLPESEGHDTHSDEVAFEGHHSHSSARWVDFYTFGAPRTVAYPIADLPVASSAVLLVVRKVLVFNAEPQSHGPPDTRPTALRSPPTV